MKRYIIALDEGTTSARALVYDTQENKVVSVVNKPFKQSYPHPGWVEQDPAVIWSMQFSAMTEAIGMAGINVREVLTIGITNQRETVVVWDKVTGKAVYPAIVWQCNRTADFCGKLLQSELSDTITKKTGLRVDSYFSASKLAWILDNVQGARDNENLIFGTVDTYLLWKLTEGRVHATDYTNASRTLLYNITEGKWDEELCKIFNVPMRMLPEVHPSSHYYGECDIFDEPIPITAIAGDQQSALFGQGCHTPGSAKNTYGTGCFMLVNTGEHRRDSEGLLTTLSCSDKLTYALEGSVFNAGSTIEWLKNELGLINSHHECEPLARSIDGTDGVYFVPAFSGLGTPYWDSDARGTITGLTRGSGKAHIVRAVLEAMAYSVCDIAEAMSRAGEALTSLKVDGGVSKNSFLMQFQADLLGVPVLRSENVEATAMGAIALAGKYFGVEVQESSPFVTFEPSMARSRADELIYGWKRAVEKARLR